MHKFALPTLTYKTSIAKSAFILTLSLISNIANSWANNPTSHISPLDEFTAEYDAVIKGFAVKATREYKATSGTQYELSFRASSWAAKINEVSTFSWTNGRTLPTSYQFTQSALGKKKEHTHSFTQTPLAIRYQNGDQKHTINLTQQAYDKLNYQLQLQADVLAGESTLAYDVISKDSLRKYAFEVLGEETIDTKLGKLLTVKIHVTRKDDEKNTYIWLAKDWNYLLAKLEQLKNDKKTFSIVINQAVVNEKTVSGL